MNKINYFNAVNNTKFTHENLLCKLCMEWLWPKVFLLKNGDNICLKCHNTKQITKYVNHNIPLELLLDKVLYPCMNSICTYAGVKEDYIKHKNLCFYASIKCPFCEEDDLTEAIFIDHLLEHKKSGNYVIEKHSSDSPHLTLELKSTINANVALHIIEINTNYLIVMFIGTKDPIDMNITVAQLYAPKDILDYKFTIVFNKDRNEIRISGDIFSMRKVFNQNQISTKCPKYMEAKLYFANYENAPAHLMCPVCFSALTSKFFSCKNKHFICANCKSKINTCPICRVNINPVGIDLISLPFNIPIPCENISRGCLEFVGSREHKDVCSFAEYSCSEERCSYANHKLQVMDHMRNQHKVYHMGYGFKFDGKKSFEAFIDRSDNMFKIKMWFDKDKINVISIGVQLLLCNNKKTVFRYEVQFYDAQDFKKQICRVGNFCKIGAINTQSSVNVSNWPVNVKEEGIFFQVYIFNN